MIDKTLMDHQYIECSQQIMDELKKLVAETQSVLCVAPLENLKLFETRCLPSAQSDTTSSILGSLPFVGDVTKEDLESLFEQLDPNSPIDSRLEAISVTLVFETNFIDFSSLCTL